MVASFTRQIPPGGDGKISVKLNTFGYGGKTLKKTIKVYTNDKENPVSDITIAGEVKKFANVSPARVMLNGEVGQSLKVAVKISPVSKGLFEIAEAKADQGKDIRFTLTDGEETGNKVYTLGIENTRTTAGRYHDIIRLLTTSKVQQEILIPIWGNITPPQIAAIRPRHVALNGPAGTPIKGTVTIVPRDDYPFSISEAKAQIGTYIKWDLKETAESGKKTYTLTVENLKKEKGSYYDTIFLKTGRTDQPEIRINVSGRITD
jgi:hypothetical protein